MNEIFHRTSIRKYLDKFLKIWTLSPLFHAAIRKWFMLNRIVLTSNLLSNGATPKDVLELLGHSDVSTTMNVYTKKFSKGHDIFVVPSSFIIILILTFKSPSADPATWQIALS